MATDNTRLSPAVGEDGDLFLTEVIETLDGEEVEDPEAKAQDIKLGFGGHRVFTRVSAENPLPITGNVVLVPPGEGELPILKVEAQASSAFIGRVGLDDGEGGPPSVLISGTPTVSVSGVATATKQDDQSTLLETIITALGTIATALSDAATATLQGAANTLLSAIDTKLGGTLTVGLPTGASTSAKQDTEITSLASIDTKLSSQATAAKQDTGNTSLGSILTALGSQATAALQTAGNALLTTIDAKLGGTLTVDGSGHTQPVSGTVTVSGSVTADTELTTADLDTGAGTDTRAVVGLAIAESGGGLLVGSAHPMPVSGTVTANAGTNLNTSTLALETGGNLATCATQITACAASLSVLDDFDESDRCKVNPVVGQAGLAAGTGADAANALRVSLATNVPLPTGTNSIGKLGANSGVVIGDVNAVCTNAGVFACQDSQVVTDNAGFTDGTTKVFVSGFIYDETAGTVLTENDAAAARLDAKRAQVHVLEDATTRGQRQAVHADGSAQARPPIPTTFTGSNVSGSASSVQLLAANSSRKTLSIENDSTAVLSVKLGTTASATDRWKRLDPGEQYECTVDLCGTGRIDGIWGAANGSARLVEGT